MKVLKPAAVTAMFFAIAPAAVAGVIPWPITRWRFRPPLRGWFVGRHAESAMARRFGTDYETYRRTVRDPRSSMTATGTP
jgi:protein-S-isoprenylcysteine O-methyltransferase Ste14